MALLLGTVLPSFLVLHVRRLAGEPLSGMVQACSSRLRIWAKTPALWMQGDSLSLGRSVSFFLMWGNNNLPCLAQGHRIQEHGCTLMCLKGRIWVSLWSVPSVFVRAQDAWRAGREKFIFKRKQKLLSLQHSQTKKIRIITGFGQFFPFYEVPRWLRWSACIRVLTILSKMFELVPLSS